MIWGDVDREGRLRALLIGVAVVLAVVAVSVGVVSALR